MDFQFKVKKSERGKRLDGFLHDKMENWSHRQVKNVIDKKRVFVNGKNVFISSWNLKPDDRVMVKPLKDDLPQAGQTTRYHFVNVLLEDNYILVTNKPAHIDYDSFVANVDNYLKRQVKGPSHPYVGQMHRLDKETSGVLIFTKKKIANTLSDQFKRHTIRKIYLVIVSGRVEKEHGIIKDAIEKGKFDGGKKARIAEEGEGKESISEYWVEERYENATLLRVEIKTGRTHQIRIHMVSIGHPVLGDKLYAAPKTSSKAVAIDKSGPKLPGNLARKAPLKPKRQMLHAHVMQFYHPVTGEKTKVEAPIPDDFIKMLENLRGY